MIPLDIRTIYVLFYLTRRVHILGAPGKLGSKGKEVVCLFEIRGRNPAGESPARPKPSQRAGSESWVAQGRSVLLSVDSE